MPNAAVLRRRSAPPTAAVPTVPSPLAGTTAANGVPPAEPSDRAVPPRQDSVVYVFFFVLLSIVLAVLRRAGALRLSTASLEGMVSLVLASFSWKASSLVIHGNSGSLASSAPSLLAGLGRGGRNDVGGSSSSSGGYSHQQFQAQLRRHALFLEQLTYTAVLFVCVPSVALLEKLSYALYLVNGMQWCKVRLRVAMALSGFVWAVSSFILGMDPSSSALRPPPAAAVSSSQQQAVDSLSAAARNATNAFTEREGWMFAPNSLLLAFVVSLSISRLLQCNSVFPTQRFVVFDTIVTAVWKTVATIEALSVASSSSAPMANHGTGIHHHSLVTPPSSMSNYAPCAVPGCKCRDVLSPQQPLAPSFVLPAVVRWCLAKGIWLVQQLFHFLGAHFVLAMCVWYGMVSVDWRTGESVGGYLISLSAVGGTLSSSGSPLSRVSSHPVSEVENIDGSDSRSIGGVSSSRLWKSHILFVTLLAMMDALVYAIAEPSTLPVLSNAILSAHFVLYLGNHSSQPSSRTVLPLVALWMGMIAIDLQMQYGYKGEEVILAKYADGAPGLFRRLVAVNTTGFGLLLLSISLVESVKQFLSGQEVLELVQQELLNLEAEERHRQQQPAQQEGERDIAEEATTGLSMDSSSAAAEGAVGQSEETPSDHDDSSSASHPPTEPATPRPAPRSASLNSGVTEHEHLASTAVGGVEQPQLISSAEEGAVVVDVPSICAVAAVDNNAVVRNDLVENGQAKADGGQASPPQVAVSAAVVVVAETPTPPPSVAAATTTKPSRRDAKRLARELNEQNRQRAQLQQLQSAQGTNEDNELLPVGGSGITSPSTTSSSFASAVMATARKDSPLLEAATVGGDSGAFSAEASEAPTSPAPGERSPSVVITATTPPVPPSAAAPSTSTTFVKSSVIAGKSTEAKVDKHTQLKERLETQQREHAELQLQLERRKKSQQEQQQLQQTANNNNSNIKGKGQGSQRSPPSPPPAAALHPTTETAAQGSRNVVVAAAIPSSATPSVVATAPNQPLPVTVGKKAPATIAAPSSSSSSSPSTTTTATSVSSPVFTKDLTADRREHRAPPTTTTTATTAAKTQPATSAVVEPSDKKESHNNNNKVKPLSVAALPTTTTATAAAAVKKSTTSAALDPPTGAANSQQAKKSVVEVPMPKSQQKQLQQQQQQQQQLLSQQSSSVGKPLRSSTPPRATLPTTSSVSSLLALDDPARRVIAAPISPMKPSPNGPLGVGSPLPQQHSLASSSSVGSFDAFQGLRLGQSPTAADSTQHVFPSVGYSTTNGVGGSPLSNGSAAFDIASLHSAMTGGGVGEDDSPTPSSPAAAAAGGGGGVEAHEQAQHMERLLDQLTGLGGYHRGGNGVVGASREGLAPSPPSRAASHPGSAVGLDSIGFGATQPSHPQGSNGGTYFPLLDSPSNFLFEPSQPQPSAATTTSGLPPPSTTYHNGGTTDGNSTWPGLSQEVLNLLSDDAALPLDAVSRQGGGSAGPSLSSVSVSQMTTSPSHRPAVGGFAVPNSPSVALHPSLRAHAAATPPAQQPQHFLMLSSQPQQQHFSAGAAAVGGPPPTVFHPYGQPQQQLHSVHHNAHSSMHLVSNHHHPQQQQQPMFYSLPPQQHHHPQHQQQHVAPSPQVYMPVTVNGQTVLYPVMMAGAGGGPIAMPYNAMVGGLSQQQHQQLHLHSSHPQPPSSPSSHSTTSSQDPTVTVGGSVALGHAARGRRPPTAPPQ